MEQIPQTQDIMSQQRQHYPLLTAEQEVEHCEAIEAGLFARERLDNAALNGEELDAELTQDLHEVATIGQSSFDIMVNSNLRMVHAIANKWSGSGVPHDDLVQYGVLMLNDSGEPNLGLMTAIYKFDHRKGYKFSSFGYRIVEQAIQRSIVQYERRIRVPGTASDKAFIYRQASATLRTELQREPTDEEIQTKTGLLPRDIRTSKRIVHTLMGREISLDEPAVDEVTRLNLVESKPVGLPAIPAENPTLELARQYLNEHEWLTLAMSVGGLENGRVYTTAEMAEEFGISQASVNQRLRKARGILAKQVEPVTSAA